VCVGGGGVRVRVRACVRVYMCLHTRVIVTHTLRMVEASQSRIRLVGLSATLPNYADVAVFLRVNPRTDLFPFDSTYRPVPLTQQVLRWDP